MRLWIVLVFSVLLLTLPTSVQAQSGQVTHVVQPGENLFRIALRYGVTVEQIMAANALTDPSYIYVGQTLVIPIAAATNPQTPPVNPNMDSTAVHIVQAGETLSQIALRYSMPAQRIAADNHLSNVNMIFIGQRLTIGPTKDIKSATLAPKHVLLPVPVYGQQHSLSCEAAAARMMAAYYNVEQSESWFQSMFGLNDDPHHGFRGNVDGEFGWINDYGTYAEPIAQALSTLGISATVRYDMTYDEVRDTLDHGAPVIVWTSPRTDVYDMPTGYQLVPEEHTYVVIGYDIAGFVVNDSLFGGRQLKLSAIPDWERFGNMAVVGPAIGTTNK